MKKILVCLAAAAISCSGCSGYTYNGIRADQIKDMTWKHAAGAAVSVFIVHPAGHIAYAQLTGHDWHIEGSSEIVDGAMTDSDAAWFGRAGFLLQLAFGYGAKAAGCKSGFWDGYNLGTQFEIMTYPLRRNSIEGGGDDFEMMDRSGNAWAEWALYSALAAGLSVE